VHFSYGWKYVGVYVDTVRRLACHTDSLLEVNICTCRELCGLSPCVALRMYCIDESIHMSSRFQWPYGLRRRCAAARLLGLRFRILPWVWMFVSCECCVLSSRGLCDGLIICPEESYRMWCVLSVIVNPWQWGEGFGPIGAVEPRGNNCKCRGLMLITPSIALRVYYIGESMYMSRPSDDNAISQTSTML